MRTRATVLLAATLLALTACTSDDEPGSADGEPSVSAKPSASADQPSSAPGPADTAGLEAAVREYTAAYFANKPDSTYGMLSARCKERITRAGMAALTERAVGDYGAQDVKRFEVDEMSGDVARVSYGVGMPKFDQKQEPWTREAGVWRYDDC
ncbi:hypothetical protein [Streptomyces europaeiscabiei]|uniref:hypothetical protein n=1 Tax=Streptomyces europaeiscabiei TaxID=146819 RepID=UPI002E2A00A8|nr:hypothetical protein [Streptomyces europaeiscabiei]